MRLCISFLLFFSFFSYSGTLRVPQEISVISINGEVHQDSFFLSARNIPLISGPQVLVLQYKDIFENYDDDDHIIVKSTPFILIFNSAKNEQLLLRLPQITDENEARSFIKQLNVKLFDTHDVQLSVFTQNLMDYQKERIVQRQVLSRDENVSDDNVLTGMNIETIDNTSPENSLVFIKLQHWWQKASAEQKLKFQHYIRAQEQLFLSVKAKEEK